MNAGLQIKLQLNVSLLVIPSSKFKDLLIVLEKQEVDLLKAQKEERRALREKKALQKAKQQANLPSDGEGEYVARPTPTVCFFIIYIIFKFLIVY